MEDKEFLRGIIKVQFKGDFDRVWRPLMELIHDSVKVLETTGDTQIRQKIVDALLEQAANFERRKRFCR